MTSANSVTLLAYCPDQKGLNAAITAFIAQNNGNILQLDQHVDADDRVFFLRIEWDLDGFAIPRAELPAAFAPLAAQFGMTWELKFSQDEHRLALFVSKQSHCLYEVLSRWQSGEWRVQIPLVVSNHPDLQDVVHKFGINFHVFRMTADNKPAQEEKQIKLLRDHDINLVVLAKYMQILSDGFINQFPNQIINIHHSFLPAFVGAKPYHAAHERGVKITGATCHYVTAELDAGPIIEQDVSRFNTKDSVKDLIRKGKDIEKIVLARGIYHHLNHHILVYKNRTVIFR